MTLHELQLSDFPRAETIFAPLSYQLAVPAVLAGQARGRVFVNDPQAPRCGLLWVGHRIYLAGDPQHAPFAHGLRRWFLEDLFPQQPEHQYRLYFDSPAWFDTLQTVVLPDHLPVSGMNEYYSLNSAHGPEAAAIPAEFQLHQVDQALLAQALDGLEELTEEMMSERVSVEDFLAHSFGVVLVDPQAQGAPQGKIITWCLSEYNLGERCEVGIATDPAYRKRGLAAATGAAFVELARQKGIREIGWHCWQDNYGSSAAARRIGFSRAREYPSGSVVANRLVNLAVHGIVQMDQGNDEAAAEWFARALALGEGPWWVYFRSAWVAVRLGRPSQALDFLDQAVDREGMPGPEWLGTVAHLESLHGEPRWQALLDRLARQAQ